MAEPGWDAVVLTGGASTRFGADKLAARVAGRSLLDHAFDAVIGANVVVAVGPPPTERATVCIREDPPGSGPACALAAALPHLRSDVVLVLAADQVGLPARIEAVLTAVDRDGAVLVHDGRAQWLLAAYRTTALRALDPPAAGTAVRDWLAGLDLVRVEDPLDMPLDVDTPADLHAARLASGSVLEDWVNELAEHLAIDPAVVDVEAVLDLARDAAHGVSRPAAPVSTFLAGYAAARSGGDADAVRAALARASELAARYSTPES